MRRECPIWVSWNRGRGATKCLTGRRLTLALRPRARGNLKMPDAKPVWKTPTGLSAIAALLTAFATGFALLIQAIPQGPQPQPSAAPTTAVEYKHVFSPSLALQMEVPSNWEAGPSDIKDLRTGAPIGPGLTATADSARYPGWLVPAAVLGASRELALEFGFDSSRPAAAMERLRAYSRGADWTLSGCVFQSEDPYTRDGYQGLVRRWRHCGQVGAYFWELIAIAPGNTAVVQLQVTFLDALGVELAERILATFVVTEASL